MQIAIAQKLATINSNQATELTIQYTHPDGSVIRTEQLENHSANTTHFSKAEKLSLPTITAICFSIFKQGDRDIMAYYLMDADNLLELIQQANEGKPVELANKALILMQHEFDKAILAIFRVLFNQFYNFNESTCQLSIYEMEEVA